jgi:hypothetical protein
LQLSEIFYFWVIQMFQNIVICEAPNPNASCLVWNAPKSLAAGAPPQTPLGELAAVMGWERNKTGNGYEIILWVAGAAFHTVLKNNNGISLAIIRNFLFSSYPNLSEIGICEAPNASFLVWNAPKSLAAGAPPQTPLWELAAVMGWDQNKTGNEYEIILWVAGAAFHIPY